MPSDILWTSQRPDLVLIYHDKQISCSNWFFFFNLILKLLTLLNLIVTPTLSSTSALSLSTTPSFLLLRLDQEALSHCPLLTFLPPSFLQSHLSIPNAFTPFPTLLPSSLILFSALAQTPPGSHLHLSCLPPLDPYYFLHVNEPVRGASPSFISPLLPFLVGYPFFCIFLPFSFMY